MQFSPRLLLLGSSLARTQAATTMVVVGMPGLINYPLLLLAKATLARRTLGCNCNLSTGTNCPCQRLFPADDEAGQTVALPTRARTVLHVSYIFVKYTQYSREVHTLSLCNLACLLISRSAILAIAGGSATNGSPNWAQCRYMVSGTVDTLLADSFTLPTTLLLEGSLGADAQPTRGVRYSPPVGICKRRLHKRRHILYMVSVCIQNKGERKLGLLVMHQPSLVCSGQYSLLMTSTAQTCVPHQIQNSFVDGFYNKRCKSGKQEISKGARTHIEEECALRYQLAHRHALSAIEAAFKYSRRLFVRVSRCSLIMLNTKKNKYSR